MMLTALCDGRNGITCCQRYDPITLAVEKWCGRNSEPGDARFRQSCKQFIELLLGTSIEDAD
jgi:hypothetical protein